MIVGYRDYPSFGVIDGEVDEKGTTIPVWFGKRKQVSVRRIANVYGNTSIARLRGAVKRSQGNALATSLPRSIRSVIAGTVNLWPQRENAGWRWCFIDQFGAGADLARY
jgi:hypothetical protein